MKGQNHYLVCEGRRRKTVRDATAILPSLLDLFPQNVIFIGGIDTFTYAPSQKIQRIKILDGVADIATPMV